jgi:cellulose synthase/poly-beta-1,6-N-acetylglucosamine synthase-like glycosyltransferase
MTEFSIIIPFQTITPYLRETLDHIAKLKGPDFEVILLPDALFSTKGLGRYDYPLRTIPTGSVSPAIKRDNGAKVSQGKYLAFIDDDAYPSPDWLTRVLPHFNDENITAVGGPQITPEQDGFWQKVSGAMFLSPLNGKAVYRYWPAQKCFFVDDWPSVNLIVRKEDFIAVGGFDSGYWPGEDTKLCLDLIEKQNKKIMYEPEAKVFHHRRAGFFKHIKQVGNYGLHRGYFAKRFPATSFKLSYMLPSCFFLFVCLGWTSFFVGSLLTNIYFFFWLLYLLALSISTMNIYTKLMVFKIAVATIPYLAGTHFWYGYRFLKGFFFVKDLKSRLGR